MQFLCKKEKSETCSTCHLESDEKTVDLLIYKNKGTGLFAQGPLSTPVKPHFIFQFSSLIYRTCV